MGDSSDAVMGHAQARLIRNMPDAQAQRCSNEACGATHSATWYGSRPHKYCKRAGCVALGKERGHIKDLGVKRQRTSATGASANASSGTVVSVHKIYGCRFCDTAELDAVEIRNGIAEDDVVGSIEYLVHGHFEDDERDSRGYDGMRWVPLTDLNEALEAEAVDAALDVWEQHSAKVRARALTDARRPGPSA